MDSGFRSWEVDCRNVCPMEGLKARVGDEHETYDFDAECGRNAETLGSGVICDGGNHYGSCAHRGGVLDTMRGFASPT